MNTCDTCRFYVKKNTLFSKKNQRKYFDGIIVCSKVMVSFGQKPESPDQLAADGQLEEEFLIIPNPKFGCIHHETKQFPTSLGIAETTFRTYEKGQPLE